VLLNRTLRRNLLNLILIIFASLSIQAQEKADSIKVKIKASADTLKSTGINTISNTVKKGFTTGLKQYGKIDSIKPRQLVNKFAKDKLAALGLSKDSVKKFPKVKFENFGVENSVLYQNQNPLDAKPGYQNNVTVVGRIQVGKFPINVNFTKPVFSNQKYNPFEGNLFKMDFDKAKYLQGFQSEITKAANFKKNILSGMDVSSYLQKNILKELKSKLGAQSQLDPNLSKLLSDPVQVQNLLKMDASQLKEKLRSVILNQQTSISALVTENVNQAKNTVNPKIDTKIEQKNSGNSKIDSAISNKKASLTNKISNVKSQVATVKVKTREEINASIASATKVITDIKSKIDDLGLNQRRLELIEKFISNNATAQDLGEGMFNELAEQPKFKGLQKFYSKIQDLHAGGYAHKVPGGFMNEDMFVKGASIAINTRRGPVTLGYGSNQDVGLPKDQSFNSSIFSSPKILSYMSVPTTRFSQGSGKLSWDRLLL
jgi:hypothetical protein